MKIDFVIPFTMLMKNILIKPFITFCTFINSPRKYCARLYKAGRLTAVSRSLVTWVEDIE